MFIELIANTTAPLQLNSFRFALCSSPPTMKSATVLATIGIGFLASVVTASPIPNPGGEPWCTLKPPSLCYKRDNVEEKRDTPVSE